MVLTGVNFHSIFIKFSLNINNLVSESSDAKSKDSKVDSMDVEIDSDSEIEDLDSDEWDETVNPIDNNDCIFCLHHSKNFIKNLEHMTIVHSFFIPDIEYCTDLTGLLRYLGEKISEGKTTQLFVFKLKLISYLYYRIYLFVV